jgi:transposase
MSSNSPKRVNIEEIHRLYYEENLTQRQVAEKLGLSSHSTINRLFKENGWKARPAAPPKQEADSTEVYRLYFVHGKSMKEISEQLGLKGISPIQRVFRENGWKARGSVKKRRQFNNDAERAIARKNRDKAQFQEIKTLREQLFGTSSMLENSGEIKVERKVETLRRYLFGRQCHFCGTEFNGRRLTIHRKDGRQHRSVILWSERNLKSLNPSEWVLLCQKCHRYVHWAMDNLQMKWENFEQG